MVDLIAQYRCVLEDLKRERERMVRSFNSALKSKDHGIAEIERRLRELESAHVEVSSEPESPVSKERYTMMTRGEAGVDFLRSKGQPQKTGVIAAALTAGGLHSSYLATYKALLKLSERENPEVERLGKHGWGLIEWRIKTAAA
jgi:hypothetical protein